MPTSYTGREAGGERKGPGKGGRVGMWEGRCGGGMGLEGNGEG